MDKMSDKDFQRPQYQAMLKNSGQGIYSVSSALIGLVETMRKFWNIGVC